jgi:P27 family predicted phage terminase small subunit
MGLRGPGAKPKSQKTRQPANTLKPDPPPDMTKEAAKIWRTIIEDAEPGYCQPMNSHLLQCYCESAAQHAWGCSELELTGLIVVNEKSGAIKKSPILAVIDAAASKMATLSTKLGLNIPSRPIPAHRGPSKFGNLINRPPRPDHLIYGGKTNER